MTLPILFLELALLLLAFGVMLSGFLLFRSLAQSGQQVTVQTDSCLKRMRAKYHVRRESRQAALDQPEVVVRRMRALNLEALVTNDEMSQLGGLHRYYEQVESRLEQWFGLYERKRISSDTYQAQLVVELERIVDDRRQFESMRQSLPIAQGIRDTDFEQIDKALEATRWCLAWLDQQSTEDCAAEARGTLSEIGFAT